MLSSRRNAEPAMAVVMYSTCSISMIILNKLLMHSYKLNYPNALLFLQNFGAFAIVTIAKALHMVEFPDFDWRVVRRWLPLTVLFVAMLFTSMKSLHEMAVSTQTIIKNLAIIFTAVGDSYFYGKRVTAGMYAAFSLMVLGSYVTARGDQWVTVWGLFWTFANIIVTVSYSLYMKQLLGDVSKQIGRYGPVFYNNLLSLPFFLVAGFNEFPKLYEGVAAAELKVGICLLIATTVSSMMTFGVFWCMEVTSPTTFSVVGALNKVPLTFLGMFIFAQFPETLGYVGIAVALSGGFLYTFVNLRNNRLTEKKDVAVMASPPRERLSPSSQDGAHPPKSLKELV